VSWGQRRPTRRAHDQRLDEEQRNAGSARPRWSGRHWMRTWRREGGDSDGDGAALSDPRVREALSGQGVYARAHGSAAPARTRVAWRMAPGGDRAPMCGP
jgi:hypothetical protein